LFYSITRSTRNKRLYLKLVNASSEQQTVDVKFSGGNLASTGKLVSLEAHSTQATNTIDQPNSLVPIERTVRNLGGTLHYTMPPYSIQVLAIDQR
jgi:alpha-L-arabinofuranosidase